MSRPVVTVRPDTPLSEVARVLAARHISGVPVLEGERVVGLVSEADLLRRPPGKPARRARDVMTRTVRTVEPVTPIAEVAGMLERHGIKRVPVVEEGRLVGIVSRSNLVQALALSARAEEVGTHDEAIRGALLAALSRAPGWQAANANVIVRGGVVHFWGKVGSEPQRDADRAAALAIAGVVRVEDHRALREPRLPAGGEVRRAAERGHSRHGLVDSWHSFSFGNYYDPAHPGYGPLRALNEKRIQPGASPTTYGLRDVEVLTYVVEGEFSYEDSMDNLAMLVAGGVQHMSAGSGMRHSERNGSETRPCHLLQLWIDPDELGVEPSYERLQLSADERRGRPRIIASPDGREGSLRMCQNATLYAALFDRDQRAELPVAAERKAYVHVARGRLAANEHALGPGDALKIGSGPLILTASESAEVLVLDVPD